MKSRQFCSVCKQWLDMEVVPTGDGDDDGVVWFRCPQCQGFLPKLSATVADAEAGEAGDAAGADAEDPAFDPTGADRVPIVGGDDDADDDADEVEDDDAPETAAEARGVGRGRAAAASVEAAGEPVLEYAALLAAVDPTTAVPYRPWETYEVGQCVLHLAWNDCGVVVAKEALPGGRRVVKCWFQGAGVVRLIENAPR